MWSHTARNWRGYRRDASSPRSSRYAESSLFFDLRSRITNAIPSGPCELMFGSGVLVGQERIPFEYTEESIELRPEGLVGIA